jgi:hypothetical protein
MAKTIDEVKAQVSRKYLGKFGVHGVGISRSQNAIKLYVDQGSEIAASRLKAIEQDASPCKVLIIREESPKIT